MFLDGLTRVRLEWMFDNEPEYLDSLLQSNNLNELEEVLNSRVVEAIKYAESL